MMMDMAHSEVSLPEETSVISQQICKSESRDASRATHSMRPAKDVHSNTNLEIDPFGFEAKTSFAAIETLTNTRSANFEVKRPEADDNIWKRPPPDFRPQVYAPNPPKRNSREAMQPWKYKTTTKETEKTDLKQVVKLPQIRQAKSAEEPLFHTQFHIMNPFEAKIDFVKAGQFRSGSYHMPQPHDFRQYPDIHKLGLPEFDTSYDKDPFNIKFNSKRLQTLHGLMGKAPTERDIVGRQMAPPLPSKPRWEARLIMPTEPWPSRYHAYTRYRLPYRSPHSALMDRVEDTLDTQWAKEKMEDALRKQHEQSC